MQTATKQGLVFKRNKCAIYQPQISHYGANFATQGMKPNPVKVQALQDVPPPKNVQTPQSFLV